MSKADALVITAGAGMGVDSGLPDFRGDKGFWKAYPPFRGRTFEEISNPIGFESDPQQAWGFFGHRFNLYRATVPHRGFRVLLGWAQACTAGYFIFTSNIVVVDVDRSKIKNRLSALDPPTHSGLLHPVLHQVTAGALHHAAADRIAGSQVLVVLHVFTPLGEIVQVLLDFLLAEWTGPPLIRPFIGSFADQPPWSMRHHHAVVTSPSCRLGPMSWGSGWRSSLPPSVTANSLNGLTVGPRFELNPTTALGLPAFIARAQPSQDGFSG